MRLKALRFLEDSRYRQIKLHSLLADRRVSAKIRSFPPISIVLSTSE